MVAAHGVDREGEHRLGGRGQATSIATRFLYQPQLGHTVCGVLALPQRGHRLRAGALSFQALARRLRVFDFDVFFFGTAIVHFPRWDDWSMIDRFVGGLLPAAGVTRAARPPHVIGQQHH
jgi:hypothetical protein